MRPLVARSAPKSRRANSVRPEPSSPARPTTSPRWTSRSTGCTPGARPMSRALSTVSSAAGAAASATASSDLLQQVEFVAEHRRDQLHPVERGGRILTDQTAVAQHRHSVGDLVHLVEEVRDEQDRRAAVAQPAHHPEQFGDLVGVEAGRRFVEDQHPRRDRRRPRDRDQLLQRDRVVAEGGAGVDGQVELAEQFLRRDGSSRGSRSGRSDAARDPAGCSLPPSDSGRG